MYKIYKFYPKGFDIAAHWDDKYAQEHIAGKDAADFRRQGFWPLLQKQLKSDGRYLDAGCGVGGWVVFLHEEGFNVEGIDTAARTVRALTEYDSTLKVKIAPITRIPYADNTFDGLLAIGTLEYLENDIVQGMQEVHRVLKPGGWFFLEVPVANTLRRLLYVPLKRLEYALKMRSGKSATFTHSLFSPAEIKQLLDTAGFTVADIAPHELPDKHSHYGLYVDWRILRGREAYQLNWLGRIVKTLTNAISPWIASTGMVVVAQKR